MQCGRTLFTFAGHTLRGKSEVAAGGGSFARDASTACVIRAFGLLAFGCTIFITITGDPRDGSVRRIGTDSRHTRRRRGLARAGSVSLASMGLGVCNIPLNYWGVKGRRPNPP